MPQGVPAHSLLIHLYEAYLPEITNPFCILSPMN